MKKTILITGTSSGIGKSTVFEFAKMGWNVIATQRHPENELDFKDLPNVKLCALDVTNLESIKNAISLAESLDSPRGFEVVSNFAKQLAEMNKDLMGLYQQKKEIEKEKITVNNNTTNAIYVGSTSDLQDLVNQSRSRRKALDNNEEQQPK